MKRWIVVTILGVLLALAGPDLPQVIGELDRDNIFEAPVLREQINPEEVSGEPAEKNEDGGGFVTPNGAIWPKGVW